jgi:hypothetical protein
MTTKRKHQPPTETGPARVKCPLCHPHANTARRKCARSHARHGDALPVLVRRDPKMFYQLYRDTGETNG